MCAIRCLEKAHDIRLITQGMPLKIDHVTLLNFALILCYLFCLVFFNKKNHCLCLHRLWLPLSSFPLWPLKFYSESTSKLILLNQIIHFIPCSFFLFSFSSFFPNKNHDCSKQDLLHLLIYSFVFLSSGSMAKYSIELCSGVVRTLDPFRSSPVF